MRLHDYDTKVRCIATVISSERITRDDSPEEVREIILEVPSSQFEVTAGASIGVLAPGAQEFGQEHHLRLYTVANVPEETAGDRVRFPICVRRCSYLDEYSGEEYRGVASHFLCDLRAGESVTLTGPYGVPFEAPDDPEATLLLIGAGTGIAPFRAFVRHLYEHVPEFKGRIHLFHGGRTGIDLLYMNDQRNDFAQYYDRETFEAVAVLSKRPHWAGAIDWSGALESRSAEILDMLSNPHTHVYLAGLEEIRDHLDAVFATITGSAEQWAERKGELEAEKRWVELLY